MSVFISTPITEFLCMIFSRKIFIKNFRTIKILSLVRFLKLMIKLISVSYTHLDVYKRQELMAQKYSLFQIEIAQT